MSSPASELRNRVTGEVVDAAAASVAEWKPETQSDSETPDIEFVTNEDTQQQTETDSEEQTESETETSDTDANDGDNEGQTEEDEDEQEEEQQEQSEEELDEELDEELEEEELEEDEPTSKRYVILEDGKPVVVVINNPPRQQPPFPTSITIMFIVVFALIFLDNVCKLCSLMTHDKCLVRMP